MRRRRSKCAAIARTIEDLNDDALLVVLKHVPLFDRLRVATVSRRWASLVHNASLWEHIDLSSNILPDRKPLTTQQLTSLIRASRWEPTAKLRPCPIAVLDIHGTCVEEPVGELTHLAVDACPNLRELYAYNLTYVGPEHYHWDKVSEFDLVYAMNLVAHRANPPVLHVDLYFSSGNRLLSGVPRLARGLKHNLAVLHSLTLDYDFEFDPNNEPDGDENYNKCQRFLCAAEQLILNSGVTTVNVSADSTPLSLVDVLIEHSTLRRLHLDCVDNDIIKALTCAITAGDMQLTHLAIHSYMCPQVILLDAAAKWLLAPSASLVELRLLRLSNWVPITARRM